jgi:flagellar basal-body rod modification protein FlgD
MSINPIDQSLIDSLGLNRKQDTADTDKLGQSDFLKLMTTQLNNQDPIKPMETSEFFNQISQFTSVAGIQELQNTFAKVADAMFSGQALQASSLVGRDVMLESSGGNLYDNGTIDGAIDLASASDDVRVNIYTQSGELVKVIGMGPQAQGTVNFSWDGLNDKGIKQSPGTYVIKSEASYGKENYSQTTWIKERIDSVTLGNGLQDVRLNMANGIDITFGQIKKIL